MGSARCGIWAYAISHDAYAQALHMLFQQNLEKLNIQQ